MEKAKDILTSGVKVFLQVHPLPIFLQGNILFCRGFPRSTVAPIGRKSASTVLPKKKNIWRRQMTLKSEHARDPLFQTTLSKRLTAYVFGRCASICRGTTRSAVSSSCGSSAGPHRDHVQNFRECMRFVFISLKNQRTVFLFYEKFRIQCGRNCENRSTMGAMFLILSIGKS